MDEIEKVEIPEDKVERFWVMVLMFAQEMGIENHKDIYHNVELLGKAVERYLVERNLPTSPQKKVSQERAKFISIFKRRYVELTDYEYERVITGADSKLMNQVNKKLKECGFDCDDYLKWMFEDFLPDNPKFCPPVIKQVCAGWYMEKFLYEHRELAHSRKKDKIRMSESSDLLNRCRALIRKEGQSKDVISDIKISLENYKKNAISLEELRTKVQNWEGE
jgi:hypothetical protein